MTAYKDYTNIAGTPFQPYVGSQIEKRKELIAKNDRSSSDLQWLTNKNAWIRISSGTDVENNNPSFDIKGQGLARKYILQGGLIKNTLTENSDFFETRSGIGEDGAYGIGGTDFGYRPMPGLTNLTIKTGGKLGTLREASFDFTCYNMKQLDIMSSLYMRLGFGVLIEWGHTPYIINEGRLETNPIPLNFFGIKDKEALMKQIQTQRVLHSGNYDALWGTVKNFSYSLEDNGTFKCQVQLVGAGDILESLKINQSGNTSKNEDVEGDDKSIYATVSDKNKSLLNEALYEYFEKVIEFNYNEIGFQAEASTSFLSIVEKYLKPKLDISFNIKGNEISWFKNQPLQRKGYHFSLLTNLNEDNGGTDEIEIPDIPNPSRFFSRFVAGYLINGVEEVGNDITKPGLEQAYITLGHLLLLIKATGWLYDRNDDKDSPYCYIDVNPETNRCYTFSGHCSLDPTVCLIGSETLPFEIKDSKLFTELQEKYPFYDTNNHKLGGRFMQTLVNIEFITSTLSNLSDRNKEGDVYFIDFLQTLLNGISKACGGFNEFRIVTEDNSGCIRIFDDRITSSVDAEKDDYTEIPVLGKKSIVYNFNYTTKISPQMATKIVISATSQDKGTIIDKDALAFSHLNEGLKNRLAPSRVESVTDMNEDPQTSTLSIYQELRSHLEGIYDGVGLALVTSEDLDIIRTAEGITPEGVRDFEPLRNEETFIKGYLQKLLEATFNDLIKSSENLTPVERDGRDERKRLADARDLAIKTIDNLKRPPIRISNGVSIDFDDPDRTNFTSTLKSQISYIHDLLKGEYKAVGRGVGRFGDTEIEAAWTKLAREQTGKLGSFY